MKFGFMRNLMRWRVFVRVFLFFISMVMGIHSSYASHLVGGTATYQYLGQVGTLYKYRIKFLIYRDCNSSTPYDNPLIVGVYERSTTSAYYSLIRTDTLVHGPVTSVVPVGSSDCDFDPNVCLERTIYQKDIYLPASSAGYVITYIRCCRNDPDNLAPDMGQTYVIEIPPTNVANSSPAFSDLPVPFFCVNDTVSLDWSATDADGDELRYTLVAPYHGGSTADPIPSPSSLYLWPPPSVTYQNGYSPTLPFGPGGTALLDSITGQLNLSSGVPGSFVVGVEVKEYRNGQFIGSIIRDMQVIVVACPSNPPPLLSAVNNGPVRHSFEIYEGDAWSATLQYTDTDSLFVQDISGEVFNVVPPATSSYPLAGSIDSLNVSVVWNTVCGQARNTPYTFKVKVRDNGCPPKVVDHLFSVLVKRFSAAEGLMGPLRPCHGEEAWIDAIGPRSGVEYHWQVTGAAQLLMDRDSSIRVRFVNPTSQTQSATIYLWASKPGGCLSDTLIMDVQVGPAPAPYNFPRFLSVCDGGTVRLGDSSLVRPGYSYQWMPATGLDNPISPRPLLTVALDSPSVTDLRYVLTTTTDAGCMVWDTVTVQVYPLPQNDSIEGDNQYCVGGMFTYSIDSLGGDQFRWFIQGGQIVGDSIRSDVTVVWLSDQGAVLNVEVTNRYGCSRVFTDSMIAYSPRPDTVWGRRVVCPNTLKYYWVDTTPGSQYYWQVLNGAWVGDSTGPRVLVRWGDAGMGMLRVVEVTQEGCIGDTVTIPVSLSYSLATPPIEGPDTLCFLEDPVSYWVPPALGSIFDWSLAGNAYLVNGQGTDSVLVKFNGPGGYQVKVLERAYDSVNGRWCVGDTVRKNVWIYPIPDPMFFVGDSIGCLGRTSTYVAFLGDRTDTVLWSVDPFLPMLWESDSVVRFAWMDTGRFLIRALPISPDGCPGRGDSLEVRVYPTPPIPILEGATTVCLPDSAQTYRVSALPGWNVRYYWGVSGGNVVDSMDDTVKVVDWNGYPVGQLVVWSVSDKGCWGDTLEWMVRIDSPVLRMRRVSTLETNDSIIIVEWDTTQLLYHSPLAELEKWELGQRQVPRRIPVKQQLAYWDETVRTHDFYYDYRLVAHNICGERLPTNVHRTILLNGVKRDNFTVDLAFNAYRGWKVKNYQVWLRTNEFATPQLVSELEDTTLTLDVLPYSGYQKCFRVVAISDTLHLLSYSNWWCETFEAYLWVPNAFSPDSNGVNDMFTVVGGNFRLYRLEIYNRWGERVFLTEDPKMGWDGMWKGHPAPEGTYLVRIIYQGGQQPKIFRQWLQLLR